MAILSLHRAQPQIKFNWQTNLKGQCQLLTNLLTPSGNMVCALRQGKLTTAPVQKDSQNKSQKQKTTQIH